MASTAIDKNFKKRKNDARMFAMEAGGQQYYSWARSWRRKKSAHRSRIPSPPPPPPPPSSSSEETIYLKPSPWPRRLKIAVRSKPPEPEEMINVPWPRELKVAVRSKIPEEEEAEAEYAMPGVSRCSGISIPASSMGDNFSLPSPSHYSPSPSSSSSSSGSVTSPFYDECL